MVPGVDVRFLQRVTQHLADLRLHVFKPGELRSASAVILRFGDADQHKISRLFSRLDDGIPSSEVIHRLSMNMDLDAQSSLRMLFLKRADMAENRWSGQIAFPGGRRDPDDEDDMQTLHREVYEEMGIPLKSPEFVLLGRLPDNQLQSRGLSGHSLVQARFVYLHIGELTPSVRLARHEVESVQWLPLTLIDRAHTEPQRVMHNVTVFFDIHSADMRLLVGELFPRTYLYFPSIGLPGTWRVWGLPLRTASELIQMDGKPPLDWPIVSSNNPILQHLIIDAFHGYHECGQWLHRRLEERKRTKGGADRQGARRATYASSASFFSGVPDKIDPRHLQWLLADMIILLVVVYSVAFLIYMVSTATRIALGWVDIDDSEARLLQYHAEFTPQSVVRDQRRRQLESLENGSLVDGSTSSDSAVTMPELALVVPDAVEVLLTTPAPDTPEEHAGQAKRRTDAFPEKPLDIFGFDEDDNSFELQRKQATQENGDCSTGATCTPSCRGTIRPDVNAAPSDSDTWEHVRLKVRQWAQERNMEVPDAPLLASTRIPTASDLTLASQPHQQEGVATSTSLHVLDEVRDTSIGSIDEILTRYYRRA